MAGDERNLLAGEFFGDGARLFRVASIVTDLKRELLAQQAARGVEVLDRLFGAVLHLTAEGGFAAGHRAGHADRDVLGKRRRRERERCADSQANELY